MQHARKQEKRLTNSSAPLVTHSSPGMPPRPSLLAGCSLQAARRSLHNQQSRCTAVLVQRGGKIAVWGGRIQLRKIAGKLRENCGKLRKIAGKLRKNCDVVSGHLEPSTCNSSGQVAQNCQNFTETNSPWAVQLQEAPLDITVELQHEPKAADVVIQFVLPL